MEYYSKYVVMTSWKKKKISPFMNATHGQWIIIQLDGFRLWHGWILPDFCSLRMFHVHSSRECSHKIPFQVKLMLRFVFFFPSSRFFASIFIENNFFFPQQEHSNSNFSPSRRWWLKRIWIFEIRNATPILGWGKKNPQNI